MTHTISIRTISIFAAIIGLLAIVLMTAQGNPAQGQSLPSVGSTDINVSVDEPDQSPYRVNAILTVQLSQASSQNVSVRYRDRRHHRKDRRAGLHRRQRNPVLQPGHHRADHQRSRS